ncbi:uncharacterized protein LOC143284896 isoform X2 [Babylonia areolata]
MNACFEEHGLPRFKFPGKEAWHDVNYIRLMTLTRIRFVVAGSCSDESQQQIIDGYRCYHSASRDCIARQRALATSETSSVLLEDLEQYMPDPDLIEELVHDACDVQGVNLHCLLSKALAESYSCMLGKLTEILPLLKADDQTFSENKIRKDIKLALCRIYLGLQHCAADGVEQCSHSTASYANALFSRLTPPACRSDDQGKQAGQGKRTHHHDDI